MHFSLEDLFGCRYYESFGLLKTQGRTDGGERLYTDADVVYVNRITELKKLDFTLGVMMLILYIQRTS